MRLLSQKEIAERAGIAESTIHYIINGDREPSKAMSLALEKATLVARPAWLWPEHCFNPYIPYENTLFDGRMWKQPFDCPLKNECPTIGGWQVHREKMIEEYEKKNSEQIS